MKWTLPPSRRASGFAVRPTARRPWTYPADTEAASGFPQPGLVLGEIGLILAVHLAVALAVTVTLRAFGIA